MIYNSHSCPRLRLSAVDYHRPGIRQLILRAAWITYLIGTCVYSQDQDYTDGIVAVVNDDVITVYDVITFSSDIEKHIYSRYQDSEMTAVERRRKISEEINRNRIRAANELINHNLIYAEFQKKGYQIPNEIVEKRIDSMVAKYAGGDRKKFDQLLAESGTNSEDYRKKIQEQLAVELLINQSIDANIIISPQQIEKYYRDHVDDFRIRSKIRLQLIELRPDEDAGDVDVDHNIEQIQNDLQHGIDFGELAKQYSFHGSRDAGGDLGWLNETDIRSEFKDALMPMVSGKVSEPIRIADNAYILRIADMQGGSLSALNDVYEGIKNRLFRDEKKRRYDDYINKLRRQAYVRVFFKE